MALPTLPVRACVLELRRTRRSLEAARTEAAGLQVTANVLLQRSAEAIERMEALQAQAGPLLGAAQDARRDIEAGIREVERSRAVLVDVAAHVPDIAAAAEGLATVERRLGLVD